MNAIDEQILADKIKRLWIKVRELKVQYKDCDAAYMHLDLIETPIINAHARFDHVGDSP